MYSMNLIRVIFSFKWKYIFLTSILVGMISYNSFSQSTKISSKDSLEVHYNFIVAASQGNLKKVNEYINLGVFINYRDAQGASAIFYAVNNGYPEIVKTLLYYGANPNIGTYDNYTPLMAASANGDFDIAQLLLYVKRTKINLQDNKKISALTYATYYQHYYIVDMLLFYDAKISLLDKNYNTSLFYAALNGDTAIASRLIKAGANILHKNKDGISPLNIAIQNNDTIMFDLFLRKIKTGSIDISARQELIKYSVQFENTYALNRLLADESYTDDLHLNKDIPRYAYISENRSLIKIVDKNQFPKIYLPIFTSFQSKFSTSFNGQDYMCYMGIGLRESRYNLDFNIRYGTRFNKYSVLQQQSDNVYYQLWEKRRILGVQLRKNFLLKPIDNIIIKPFVALDFQSHWGKYNGYSKVISPNFHIVPEAGISIQNEYLVFDISYQYANFTLEGVSTSRINVGLGFIIPFYQKPIKYNIWL